MDTKKKEQLLYYYIMSSSKLNPDEIKFSVDFDIYNEKLDNYTLFITYNSYADPNIGSIHTKVKSIGNTLFDAVTKSIFDTDLKLVTKSRSKIDIEQFIHGPIISELRYKFNEDELLTVEFQFLVDAIKNYE
jgi:hypothetical protein